MRLAVAPQQNRLSSNVKSTLSFAESLAVALKNGLNDQPALAGSDGSTPTPVVSDRLYGAMPYSHTRSDDASMLAPYCRRNEASSSS